jgi:hypothetical protein
MGTHSFSAPIGSVSQANFEAFANNIYNGLIAAGAIQTADTGQYAIPFAETYPTVNGQDAPGYWMFRQPGPSHAIFPIYYKITLGRSGSSANMKVSVQSGIATDGAGTFVGTATGLEVVSINGATINTGAYPWYFCVNDEVFWFACCIGAMANTTQGFVPLGCYFATRWQTPAGAVDPEAGWCWLRQTNGSSSNNSARIGSVNAAGTTVMDNVSNKPCGIFPGHIASDSNVDGRPQVVNMFYRTPANLQTRVVPNICAMLDSEMGGVGTTFTAALVGDVLRTNIAAGRAFGNGGGGSSLVRGALSEVSPALNYPVAFLWE